MTVDPNLLSSSTINLGVCLLVSVYYSINSIKITQVFLCRLSSQYFIVNVADVISEYFRVIDGARGSHGSDLWIF